MAKKKYRVYVSNLNYGWIDVEAHNKKEAERLALEDGDFNWSDEENAGYKVMEVEEI
jgi:hypothetical protein